MSEGSSIFRIIGSDDASPAFERVAKSAERAAERIRAAGDRMTETGERLKQAKIDPPPSDSGSLE